MKIISNFKDYYDSVQIHGQDNNLIFIRKTEEISSCFHKQHMNYKGNYYTEYRNSSYVDIKPYLIGFCGKWYFMIKSEELIQSKFFYTPEDFESYVKSSNNINFKKDFYEKYQWWYDRKNITYKTIHEAFSNTEKIKDISLFLKYNTPIILIGYGPEKYKINIISLKNVCLKDINFQKVKDPYTCYQDISMFVGGVLTNNNTNMKSISDNDMRDKKGFNKWSFRRHKDDPR